MLNDLSLVLESVTLGQLVEFVVQMLVNLAGSSVLGKKSSNNSQSSHPDNLSGHSGISSTLSLTVTSMSTGSSGLVKSSSSSSRVASSGLVDNQTIGDQLSDGLSRVTRGDLSGLSRITPDLSLTASKDAGSQSLLKSEVRHCCWLMVLKNV